VPAPALGEFEQLVLLGLLRLGPEAYGAAVSLEIEQQTGRAVSVSAVHTTLDRLEDRRLSEAANANDIMRCSPPACAPCNTRLAASGG